MEPASFMEDQDLAYLGSSAYLTDYHDNR